MARPDTTRAVSRTWRTRRGSARYRHRESHSWAATRAICRWPRASGSPPLTTSVAPGWKSRVRARGSWSTKASSSRVSSSSGVRAPPSMGGLEPQPVPLQDGRRALEVGLDAVAGRQGRQGRRIRLVAGGAELAEQVLKAARRDELQHAGGGVPGVPEGVPLAAGLEDQIAGFGEDFLVAQQGPQPALQHVAVLGLAAVVVQRAGQDVRRQGVLHDREPAAGGGAVDHEPVGPGLRRPRDLPVAWAQHPRAHAQFLAGGHGSSLAVARSASTLGPNRSAAYSRKVVFPAPQPAPTVLP